jgi:hypothetical protein
MGIIMFEVMAKATIKVKFTGKMKSGIMDKTTGITTAKTMVQLSHTRVIFNDIDMLLVTAKGVTTDAKSME